MSSAQRSPAAVRVYFGAASSRRLGKGNIKMAVLVDR